MKSTGAPEAAVKHQPDYHIESVARACDILASFKSATEVLSLAAIGERCTLHKVTVLRILRTLESKGLIERVGTRGYRSRIRPFHEKRYRIGYASQSSVVAFTSVVTDSMIEAAYAAHVDLQVLNNSYSPAAGRPIGIESNEGYPYVKNVTYTPAGQMTSMVLDDVVPKAGDAWVFGTSTPAVIRRSISYNNRLQPVLESASATASPNQPAGTLFSLSYCYSNCPGNPAAGGNNGNVLEVVNNLHPDWTHNYTYDALNRVQSADGNSLVYDSFGNRYPDAFQAANLPWTFTSRNQVPAGNGLVYDGGGNVVQDAVSDPATIHNYTYDAEGRVATVDGYISYVLRWRW